MEATYLKIRYFERRLSNQCMEATLLKIRSFERGLSKDLSKVALFFSFESIPFL